MPYFMHAHTLQLTRMRTCACTHLDMPNGCGLASTAACELTLVKPTVLATGLRGQGQAQLRQQTSEG